MQKAQRISRGVAMSARRVVTSGFAGRNYGSLRCHHAVAPRGASSPRSPSNVKDPHTSSSGRQEGRLSFIAGWISTGAITPRGACLHNSAMCGWSLLRQCHVVVAPYRSGQDHTRWFADHRSAQSSPLLGSHGSDELRRAAAEGGGGGGEASGNEDMGTLREDGVPYLGPPGSGDKARVVVLGSGWAAGRILRDINTKMYDVVCISPRNHMVFTPLLASTCVGTLEFRSVAEPVRNIQQSLSKAPNSHFFLANALALHPDKHQVECQALDEGDAGRKFRVFYDKLVIATGAVAMTFNIKGVKENAIFLREVGDAMAIRRKLLLNLMLSDLPGTSVEEKRRLLHCVVVGGGPTGVEFSGELSDFIVRDAKNRFAHVKDYMKVTLIEAREILSSFDERLRRYAIRQLTKSGVELVKGVVKEVKPDRIILTDDHEVPYGLLVWSTGVGPSPFVNSLALPKSAGGRIGVDEWLKVVGMQDVWAAGDCCGYVQETGKQILPALAQVAERQGRYLANSFNEIGRNGGARAGSSAIDAKGNALTLPQFTYRHLGSMATVGRHKALVDLRQAPDGKGISLEGFISWLIWRSVYLTRVISWRNRLYVAVNWVTTIVFGRDITRI